MPGNEQSAHTATWGGEQLDLDAYRRRIGLEHPRASTLSALRTLQHAHITSIPFENGETILGRPTPLDIPSLQDKMVRQRRGGYCYEHTTLFAAALERLGFGVTGLLSRITMGAQHLLPPTHAAVQVTTEDDDRVWISDIGRGGGPLEPIELADGATLGETWDFRLRRIELDGAEHWVLDAPRPDGWLDLHQFTLQPTYPVDYVVSNHYIATHPNSPFTRRLLAQNLGDEVWHFLDATTLTSTYRDGAKHTRELEPAEVPKLLETTFDIALSREDAATLISKLARH